MLKRDNITRTRRRRVLCRDENVGKDEHVGGMRLLRTNSREETSLEILRHFYGSERL
jgi:hypothetical protein